jgi:hypothetical protein
MTNIFYILFIGSFLIVILKALKVIKSQLFYIVPSLFMILLIYTISSTESEKNSKRNEISTFIEKNGNNLKLKLNGVDIEDPTKFILGIKSIFNMGKHHSHMINEIETIIGTTTDSLKITFYIGQDSYNKEEFWVKLEKNDFRTIGGFKSVELSKYLNKNEEIFQESRTSN